MVGFSSSGRNWRYIASLWMRSVFTFPGRIEFTRISWRASSRAIVRIMPSSPDFAEM
ncbi:unannotated protein [freshwater metagenome]|uniref:Unannotated protein n=1 Tax=freshwater metagenome TaxID=449393 RepID=A0A6J6SHM5_9ZZZZ